MLENREHAVRERAYAIWEHDGKPEGKNLDHWFQAEAEMIGTAPVISTVSSPKPPAPTRVGSQRRSQSANGVVTRRAKP